MREMHTVDINCIVQELEELIGSRVDKVFQNRAGIVRIRFYGGSQGRSELLIQAGRRIHLTKFRRKAPKTPTSFAMYLRKHLGNSRLTGVSQHDFDRIVTLKFEDQLLVVELFARGNILLLDSESRVMLAMSRGPEERITRGQPYTYPQGPVNPLEISSPGELRDALKHRDLVRSLAVDIGLGKLYANELCEAKKIRCDTPPDQLADQDATSVMDWLSWLKEKLEGEKEPVVYGGDEPNEFSPFKLHIAESEPDPVESFNVAADLVYAREEGEEIQVESSSARDEKVEGLEKRLGIQREQVEALKEKSRRSREMGDLIYANFPLVNSIIEGFAGERKASRQGIIEFLGELGISGDFKNYDPEKRLLTLIMGGNTVTISLLSSTGENASMFYEKAKDLEKRAEGAKVAMAQTLREMRENQRKKIEAPPKPEMRFRQPDWYEKFRWFISSDGNLVISGRDARSNEKIFRKHLEKNDIYAHADVHGAPSTVAKAGENGIGTRTSQEACVQALIHSSLWKAGTTAGDVYWVNADQVTKRPSSGEYIARGSFVIRGRRNYLRGLEARCGIGWAGTRFMCGPLGAIKKHCQEYLELVPGARKKSDVAREIIRRLTPRHNPEIDQLIQVLPAGKLDIRE